MFFLKKKNIKNKCQNLNSYVKFNVAKYDVNGVEGQEGVGRREGLEGRKDRKKQTQRSTTTTTIAIRSKRRRRAWVIILANG